MLGADQRPISDENIAITFNYQYQYRALCSFEGSFSRNMKLQLILQENASCCPSQETQHDNSIVSEALKRNGQSQDPARFSSKNYPCAYRETAVMKDDRDRYIDPFRGLVTMPDGRRLMYDSTHPDGIFASQWSSELADPPGPYSFPAPLPFNAEIPWKKDLQWQVILSPYLSNCNVKAIAIKKRQ